MSDNHEVSELLHQLRLGNRDAQQKLVPLVYAELRRLAGWYLRRERPNHTLEATALVHEAYLRLVQAGTVDWKGRSHFFALAAHLMRCILVDYARAHRAKKRGGSQENIILDDFLVFSLPRSEELLALDNALDRLGKLDQRQSQIVEMRFFGGLSEEEIAAHLGISERTVKRDWRIAKAWLYRALSSHV